jgi:hypothetical protein
MSCSRVWFGADWRAAAVLAEAEQLREPTIDAAEFGRGRAELVGGHASGSVPFLTAPVRWARAARMAALSVGRGTSTVGSVRSRATALADEGWLLLRTVAVLGILEAA